MPAALDADWLGACRRAAQRVGTLLTELPSTGERAVEVGDGEGGDRTLIIDERAEQAVFDELDGLHGQGAEFTALSEERGTVSFGSAAVRVVIDPIDGSLNAKRGITHHALSVAVADGPTMADVAFGFVYDLGTGEEFVARRGEGARLDDKPLPVDAAELRCGKKLEVLGIESADPRWVAEAADGLAQRAHRLRAVGSIALSLCQVAAARFDGMVTLRGTRSVDAAAGQLIVREAGGLVAFPGCAEPLAAPLDLVPHSPVVAARSEPGLTALKELVR